MDAEKYEQTISACALLDDVAALPNGHETFVGSRGVMLSGGQQARLALARALYQVHPQPCLLQAETTRLTGDLNLPPNKITSISKLTQWQ